MLELQLRAKNKKLQNGDVVVRSSEGADRNPAKIDKWIQDITAPSRHRRFGSAHFSLVPLRVKPQLIISICVGSVRCTTRRTCRLSTC